MEADTGNLLFKILRFIIPLVIIAALPKVITTFHEISSSEEKRFGLDMSSENTKKALFILAVILCVGLIVFVTFSVKSMPKNNAEMFHNIFGGILSNIKIGGGPIGKLFNQLGNFNM